MMNLGIHMLAKLIKTLVPKPQLVHVPVDCSPLQHYPGYLPGDEALLRRYAVVSARVNDDHYLDGFGVKTEFQCVPFLAPKNLKLDRLQLPLPDDGFHAEGIEYAALLDAFENRRLKSRFTAVEVGSGWGPWIGLAGVLAKNHAVENLCLIGAEASAERYALMLRHLKANGLIAEASTTIRTFHGAVWTHDGEVQFPDDNVEDMGSAATDTASKTDYRGHSIELKSTACSKLSSLCSGAGEIDFLHMDVQGSEYELISSEIEWLSQNVRSIMLATHSRIIEGAIMDLLGNAGWTLRREKPCRFRLTDDLTSWAGRTEADGSQHWFNLRSKHLTRT